MMKKLETLPEALPSALGEGRCRRICDSCLPLQLHSGCLWATWTSALGNRIVGPAADQVSSLQKNISISNRVVRAPHLKHEFVLSSRAHLICQLNLVAMLMS